MRTFIVGAIIFLGEQVSLAYHWPGMTLEQCWLGFLLMLIGIYFSLAQDINELRRKW